MKLSLIIPSYMGAKYIPHIISALDAQTNKEFEVIFIVDDAKNEVSLEFLQNLKKRYNNTLHILFNSKRQKRLSSIFEGINAATGDYISICSTKDVISPDYVEKIIEIISKWSPDIIEYRFQYYKNKITPKLLIQKNRLINLEKNLSPIAWSIPFDFNKVVKRVVAQKAQKIVYVDGGSRFDFSFSFNILSLSKTYYATNKILKTTQVFRSSLTNHRSAIRAIKNNSTICKFSGNNDLIEAFAFQGWSALSIYQMQVLVVARKAHVFTNLYNSLVKIRMKKEYQYFNIHNKYFKPDLLATKLLKNFPNIRLYKKIIKKGGV